MMESVLILSVAGASLGSFVNSCAYRIPRGISLIRPRSFCLHCRRTLSFHDLLPIVSFLILRGRCRACKGRISTRYPVTELVAAALAVFFFFRIGLSTDLFFSSAFALLMILVIRIDWEHLIIPNGIIITGLLLGVLFIVPQGSSSLVTPIVEAISSVLIMAVIRAGGNSVFKRESMGWGDVKLALLIGLFLGLTLFLITLWAAALYGAAYGLLRGRQSHRDPSVIPFGAFLAGSAVVCLMFKPEIEELIQAWLILMQ